MAIFSLASGLSVCPLEMKAGEVPMEASLLLGALQISLQGGCPGSLSI